MHYIDNKDRKKSNPVLKDSYVSHCWHVEWPCILNILEKKRWLCYTGVALYMSALQIVVLRSQYSMKNIVNSMLEDALAQFLAKSPAARDIAYVG